MNADPWIILSLLDALRIWIKTRQPAFIYVLGFV